jgi:pyruvate dehydrogenase E2 component (dihydrolipoamide acetyltransferase)
MSARLFTLPDIGAFENVGVIEVHVKPGDAVRAEDPIVTLESDKATMEIPAPYAGIVCELKVAVGDRISEGAPLAMIEPSDADAAPVVVNAPAAPLPGQSDRREPASTPVASGSPPPTLPRGAQTVGSSDSSRAHASPSVRRFARELGVDLGLVAGSGPRGRVLVDDVKVFTKSVMTGARNAFAAGGQPAVAPIDFSKFGPTETVPLSRIRRLSGQALHRSWVTVPHVTQFDEADITDLESFRQDRSADAAAKGVRLTLLSFLMKAAVTALERYPEFCASLSADGESLVIKKYMHIGVAVNTDNGLVVPVVRDVDQKGVFELARELQTLSDVARAGKLTPAQLQGGCFTISSLGGIGGTAFTPIINAPEVAILGVSRATRRPVYHGDALEPRLMLPFALSYDHRVIDGVAGARFTQFLATVLADIRQILL